MTITATFRDTGQPERVWETKDDSRLQEILDRAWKKYGNPALIHDFSSTSTANASSTLPDPKLHRKKSRGY